MKLYDKSKLVRVETSHISRGKERKSLEERSRVVRVREEIFGERQERKLLERFHVFVEVRVYSFFCRVSFLWLVITNTSVLPFLMSEICFEFNPPILADC